MTIAIGLLASDGFVVAADRQETVGYQKLDQGKIRGSWKREPFGSLILTGSGDSHHLDSAMDKFQDWFKGDKTKEVSKIAAAIETANAAFYKQKVTPFASYPRDERPDYSLLIGCSMRGEWPKLWTTDRMSLRPEASYAAIGIGAATARALLAKLYVRLPVTMAINLAAFVMHEVKAAVDLCGLETDILYCLYDAPAYVPTDEIREMEDAFKLFRAVERESLHDCLSSDWSDDVRFGKTTDNANKMKAIFQSLNKKRHERLTPSAFQKSEQGQ